MTAFRSLLRGAHEARLSTQSSVKVFFTDVVMGLVAISHNTLALLGLAVVALALFVAGRPDVRHHFEAHALGWLQARQEARTEVVKDETGATDAAGAALVPVAEKKSTEPSPEPVRNAVARATAADPSELSKQQSAVALWLSRRYRVAPEPLARLVKEAWQVGERTRLEPTLILAIMAIESRFNPFAQSSVGAQGLMQVMTRVHDDKYEAFGGTHAAFDPVTNLRVGVQILRECIARAGSVEGGLRYYVGAANLAHDGGYAAKVLAEQSFLKKVAQGRSVPVTSQLPRFVPPQRPVAKEDETLAAAKSDSTPVVQ